MSSKTIVLLQPDFDTKTDKMSFLSKWVTKGNCSDACVHQDCATEHLTRTDLNPQIAHTAGAGDIGSRTDNK